MGLTATKEPEDKIYIPFGTVMTLTGTAQCTLGNTNPPMDYSLLDTSKPEVRKVRDLDKK